jgi:UPF0755 protein
LAKNSSFGSKVFKSFLIIFLLVAAVAGYYAYKTIFKSNVYLDGKKSKIVYIRTGSTYEDMIAELYEQNTIVDHASFEWLAGRMDLKNNFKPGRYRILANMSNREFINLLKYGKQEKVKLTLLPSDRTSGQLIEKISNKLEIEKDELEEFFDDETMINDRTGLNEETVRTLFIPGTYELEWTTHFDEFLALMQAEYKKVWTEERKAKAKKLNLSQSEVSILASVVQCESGIGSEQTKIAGVYLNRIKKEMPLQADPTLIYALGDFTIQRVRNGDKDINSPYNTYRYRGLPPGPICLPYIKTIDAVLAYTKHNYIFFCAKPDLSGYSDFSATYEQHQKFAAAYQKEMDRRGIKR